MNKPFSLFLIALLLGSCVTQHVAQQQAIPPNSDWRTRRDAIGYMIKDDISANIYDSADVYQRGGLYYAARRDRGDFLYSPDEAKEHLLDGVVLFITPTHAYHWEFDKGLPDGSWAYSQRTIPPLSIIETYRNGELLKREKFKDGPPPYYVETFQNGQLIEKKGVDRPSGR